MGRRIFLKRMTAPDAARAWRERLDAAGWRVAGEDLVPAAAAVGRVTARAVRALENSPAFASCAMDGVAVRARDTFGAAEGRPIRLAPGAFREVNTGNPLPDFADAVIKAEELNPSPDGGYLIQKAAAPWQHVRPIGELAARGSTVLSAGAPVTPAGAALLLTAGVLLVPVRRAPRVAIIPTGDELCPPDRPVPGKVPEVNGTLLRGAVEAWGSRATLFDVVPDDPAAIRAALLTALEDHDLVLLNAGSSAGEHDYAADVVQGAGELVVHGVDVRPGKPLLLGVVAGKPVAGLPGYPVAALVDLEWFVRPLLLEAAGRAAPCPRRLVAEAASALPSSLGDDEVVRGKLAALGSRVFFHPLPRGAANLGSVVRADGLVVIPAASEGVEQGGALDVELAEGAPAPERTLLAVGSHDLLLEVLADLLAARRPPLVFDSLNVGSMGGLRVMARGQAHLAGVHLLDPATGGYNESFLDRYLAALPHGLVHVSWREQGFLVAPGNPKGVRTVGDLARDGVRFVNRQQGSGTRILLDLRLQQAGVPTDGVQGYDLEEATHVGVAVRVAGGFADAGLGIRAAATAFGLDFVPLERERYDLVVDRAFFGSPAFEALLETLRSPGFRTAAEELGGYDVADAGRVLRTP